MSSFFASLVSSDDKTVCAIACCGVLGFVSLIAFGAYALWQDPHSFDAIKQAGGLAGILGAMGGARRLRDGPGAPQ